MWIDVAIFLFLVTITAVPWYSETSGGKRWRRKGLWLRQKQFPRLGRHRRGRALDDLEIARLLVDPGQSDWVRRAERLESDKTKSVKRWARAYLTEKKRADLFVRGIPPSVRHERDARAGF